MSTKTTFKRIALVAVAALGLGVLTSVAPANAAAKTFSLDTTSVTVVGNTASMTALFKITVKDDAATTANTALASDETITASIIGVPAGTGTAKNLATNGFWGSNSAGAIVANSDLVATSLTVPASRNGAYVAQSASVTGTLSKGNGLIDHTHAAQSDSATTASAAAINSVYYLGIQNTLAALSGTNAAIDQGAYTVQIRLTKAGFVLQTSTVTVKYVSSAAESGAAITIAQTGSLFKDVIDTHTATNNVTVSMTNGTAGGRVYLGNGLTVSTPDLSTGVELINTTTGAVISTAKADGNRGLLIADNGVIGQDISACTYQTTCDLASKNGTYGVYTDNADTLDTVTVTTSTSLRVRYGATEATAVLSFGAQPTATAAGTTAIVTATGMNVLGTSGTLAAQRAFKVPLSNKSVVYTISTGASNTDVPYIFTVTWSGAWAAANVTPVSGTLGKQTVRTDATGKASITLTNSNPVDGAIATIGITGFADDSLAVSQTITWAAPAVTTVAVSPGSYTAALKSTNTLTATVLDQFGAPMAGQVLAPVFGATTNANYVAAPATITTDASGSAKFTWTDAAASATVTTDSISFRALSNGTTYTGSTVTYSATAATAASFKSYYSHTESATTATTLVPSTGVYVGTSTDLLITQARDNGIAISLAGADAATNDLVFYYVQVLTSANAAVANAPVTITAPAGAFVLNSSNLQASSTVKVTDINGYVGFVGGSNKTGAVTFTFAAGAATGSVAQWVANATAGGRFVTLTGPATGTANGEPNLYTGSVTDRHGNPVSGVSVTINAGGAASLGGGSTAATYVTLADGKFTFTGTSFVSAGGAGTYTATATTAGDYDSSAGYVSTTSVDASLKAGNKTASVSVTWAAGNSASADAATAAADAAAEATDAANAATDAANAAAEAADAATAAAQDAADAVAALSTQVSEMVDALKKQITALTNLVIKIQKKVKA
jgi:trimeric autotransporter adhesin